MNSLISHMYAPCCSQGYLYIYLRMIQLDVLVQNSISLQLHLSLVLSVDYRYRERERERERDRDELITMNWLLFSFSSWQKNELQDALLERKRLNRELLSHILKATQYEKVRDGQHHMPTELIKSMAAHYIALLGTCAQRALHLDLIASLSGQYIHLVCFDQILFNETE